MRRARARQLFGLLLIPTPVFGVDSSPWMCGWDGAIYDLSSWTCPFPVVDMDRPLSNWGYGLAPSGLGYGPAPFGGFVKSARRQSRLVTETVGPRQG